jgi:hypothetical protein
MPAPLNDGVVRDGYGATVAVGDWVSFYPMKCAERIRGKVIAMVGCMLDVEVLLRGEINVFTCRAHRVWRLKRKQRGE